MIMRFFEDVKYKKLTKRLEALPEEELDLMADRICQKQSCKGCPFEKYFGSYVYCDDDFRRHEVYMARVSKFEDQFKGGD